ncbi:cilia- and flagella-associated protein 206 [Onthophagus taurus]|uniref:cilia- and flagella-associated protein 206 n=1 Tax=Onthophagus taurus TaxID=166361 RepID=UPI000C201063|nr:cilia- and flagella-associated protein 206-like [Onthophagus taurus]
MDEIMFKNMCKEIMRECKNRSIKVSDRFIAYYVKLLLLNPAWNISLTNAEELSRTDLQNFVKYIYTTLEIKDSPNVVTLKMQLYFQCNFDTNVNIISDYRNKLNTQLQPLEQEILNFKSIEDDDLQKLLKLIVNYLTLLHGLGNPSSDQVYQQAETALKSVFYKSELIEFILEENHDVKIDHLNMLSKLVAGIRVFNQRAMKSGEGIEDLPSLLAQANEQTHSDLHYILHDIMNFVNALTTAIDLGFIIVRDDEEDDGTLKLVLEDQNKYGSYIDYLIDLLVLYRQYEIFIRQIIDEVELSKGKLEAMFEQLENILKETYSIIYHKTMVQASIIYPQFIKIAEIWYIMQNEVIELSNINDTVENLKIYSEQTNRYEDIIYQIIARRQILTDEDRMEKTGMYRKAMLYCKNTIILNPGKIPNFDQEPLELLGFCPWKFVQSGGALIPGNPGNGVVKIKKRYYVFSCVEAILEFIKDPERNVCRVLELARLKPEVIDILRLYDQLDEVKTIYQLVKPIVKVIATADENIQTEDHPERSHIDPEYMWNVWDWKRKALKMADVAKRLTKSTQTNATSSRGSIKVQTHFLKDHNYQTKKDAGTCVPTPSTFIFGLRGRKDDKQFIITLTRPIEEKICADLTENCRK